MTVASLHYTAFIDEIIKNDEIYTIYDNGGIPAPIGEGGKRSMPFWTSVARAEKIIKNVNAYAGMKVKTISIDDFWTKWLPGLKRDGLLVGCNWSGNSATGYDCEPDSIISSLKLSGNSRFMLDSF